MHFEYDVWRQFHAKLHSIFTKYSVCPSSNPRQFLMQIVSHIFHSMSNRILLIRYQSYIVNSIQGPDVSLDLLSVTEIK